MFGVGLTYSARLERKRKAESEGEGGVLCVWARARGGESLRPAWHVLWPFARGWRCWKVRKRRRSRELRHV